MIPAVPSDEAQPAGIWFFDGGEGKGWQGHHVHEVSWDGPHKVYNIQYLIHADHHPASDWWNKRRDDIKSKLDIA